jgi:hypothetical protein
LGFAQVVFSGLFQIFADHFSDHVFECDLRGPAELFLCFGRVAQQGFHFCGAKVSGISGNNGLAGGWVPGIGCRVSGAGEYGFFVYARTFPFNFYSQCPGRNIHKIPHRMLSARGNDKVFRLVLLEHEPLHLDIVFGMAPVAAGIQISQVQAVLEPQADAGQRPGDFAGDKGFPADRGFMVEQNAVARIDAIGFPVVDADPEGIELGCGIGTAGVERGGFSLRGLLNLAVKLRGGGLVKPGFVFQFQKPDAFQQAQGAQGIGVGSVFRGFKGHGHMALGCQVVDLIRLDLLENTDQVGGIGQISIMKDKVSVVHMGVLIQVVDAVGVEQGSPALDAVDFIAFFKEEFGQVGAVLAGAAGDEYFGFQLPVCLFLSGRGCV